MYQHYISTIQLSVSRSDFKLSASSFATPKYKIEFIFLIFKSLFIQFVKNKIVYSKEESIYRNYNKESISIFFLKRRKNLN
jgi:hypothetical protein